MAIAIRSNVHEMYFTESKNRVFVESVYYGFFIWLWRFGFGSEES